MVTPFSLTTDDVNITAPTAPVIEPIVIKPIVDTDPRNTPTISGVMGIHIPCFIDDYCKCITVKDCLLLTNPYAYNIKTPSQKQYIHDHISTINKGSQYTITFKSCKKIVNNSVTTL